MVDTLTTTGGSSLLSYKIVPLIICVMFCISFYGCESASENSRFPDVAALTTEIERFLNSYFEAFGSRDTVRLREMFTDDDRFFWIDDGSVRYRSVDAVFEAIAGFRPDFDIQTELGNVGVAPLGDGTVYAFTEFQSRGGTPEFQFQFGGVMTFALERDGDTWRIVGGHSSTPRDRRVD
jgi:ketosteroid isomerase-like protein